MSILHVKGSAFYVGISLLLIIMPGCLTANLPSPPPVQPAAAPPPPSPASYGTVTSSVEKGKTTQSDLIALFGGPTIATTDPDGAETWLYEYKSSTTSTQADAQVQAKVKALNVFFYGEATGAGVASSNSQTTYSMKNLTFIIKFNKDKTVKDYSVRQVSF